MLYPHQEILPGREAPITKPNRVGRTSHLNFESSFKQYSYIVPDTNGGTHGNSIYSNATPMRNATALTNLIKERRPSSDERLRSISIMLFIGEEKA